MINKAFKIIEDNIDEADFGPGINDEKINRVENILNIKLPGSYKLFLSKYGAGDINGIEIYGVINNPDSDNAGIPNAIWITKKLREEANLPKHYFIIGDTGFGPYYAIDTANMNEDGESPVIMWIYDTHVEKIANDFGEYLYNELVDL